MERNDFFIYAISPTAVAGTGTAIATIRIGAERFFVDKITGFATTTANISLLVKLTNRNQDLSSTSIPFDMMVGTAQRPSIIPSGTLIFDVNQNVDITINNAGVGSDTVYLAFIGYKIRQG